jgi:hypothetical protein
MSRVVARDRLRQNGLRAATRCLDRPDDTVVVLDGAGRLIALSRFTVRCDACTQGAMLRPARTLTLAALPDCC